MRILFIRHGDPDYINDTLTEKGKVEAELLANMIDKLGIDDIYQSPLGRAQATAAYSLKKLGKDAITYDWLREFNAQFDPNLSEKARMAYATELKKNSEGNYEKRILWDILPSYYCSHPELFDKDNWRDSELVKCSDMAEKYDYVSKSLFELLASYGYKKNGDIFEAENGNNKTIAFFCHFGITAVLLSAIWNISPFIPLQFLASAPTSVTEIVTEEREKGKVIFRGLRFGDTTHLTIGNEKPSFSARFCECFENENERH